MPTAAFGSVRPRLDKVAVLGFKRGPRLLADLAAFHVDVDDSAAVGAGPPAPQTSRVLGLPIGYDGRIVACILKAVRRQRLLMLRLARRIVTRKDVLVHVSASFRGAGSAS